MKTGIVLWMILLCTGALANEVKNKAELERLKALMENRLPGVGGGTPSTPNNRKPQTLKLGDILGPEWKIDMEALERHPVHRQTTLKALGLPANASPEEIKKAFENFEKRQAGTVLRALGLPANASPEDVKKAWENRRSTTVLGALGLHTKASSEDAKKAWENRRSATVLGALGLPANASPEDVKKAWENRQLNFIANVVGLPANSSPEDINKALKIRFIPGLGVGLPVNASTEEIKKALNPKNIADAHKAVLKDRECSYVDENGPIFIETNRCGGICIGEIDCVHPDGGWTMAFDGLCASEGDDCPSAKECITTKRPKTILSMQRIEVLKSTKKFLEAGKRSKDMIKSPSAKGGSLR